MGVLRISKEEARELSSDLRESDARHLGHRRGVIGLALLASASLGFVGLYQMGIVKHLPEPPLRRLDADEVDASPEAYEWLSTPDAILGIGSYAGTMALAAMGASGRAKTEPWIPLALAAKTALDVFNAGRLTINQWTKHRAFCFWCLLVAGATFATVPLVIPEAREALTQRAGASSSAHPHV